MSKVLVFLVVVAAIVYSEITSSLGNAISLTNPIKTSFETAETTSDPTRVSSHEIIDKEDFNKKLENSGNNLVVVMFYAEWCGYSQKMIPVIEEMKTTMTDVLFYQVNVDKNEVLVSEYAISGYPTFVFIKNGTKIDSFAGANEEKLRETINKYRTQPNVQNSQ